MTNYYQPNPYALAGQVPAPGPYGGGGGLWSGLNAAQVSQHGVYLDPGGNFDIEIIRCMSLDSQKSGTGFLVEMEILTSTMPAHPAGARRTWWQGMKNKNVAFGAVKGFLLAVFGLQVTAERKIDFDPFLEMFITRVTGPENILAGMVVHVETVHILTKEKREPFTRHDWSQFDYETARSVGLNLTPPIWSQYVNASHQLPPPPVAAPQLDPSGKWQLVNGAWVAYTPPPPPVAPPPPPAPVAPPPPGFSQFPPGTKYSPDGAWYLPPGSNAWISMPPGVRRPV